MRTFLALASIAVASATFCSVIGSDLPSMCTCTNATDGFTLDCTPSVDLSAIGKAALNATYDFKPCANPATTGYSADIAVTAGIGVASVTKSYTLAQQSITAGQTQNIPIPDASIKDFGGFYMATTVKGNAAAFEVDLALTACEGAGDAQKCGAAVNSNLPVPILSKTFDFGAACSPASVLSPSGLSMIASAIFALMHLWH